MIAKEDLHDRLAARLSDDRTAIFLFHGVIARQRHRVRNYTGKHLPLDIFRRCMEKLARTGYALSMNDVLNHCRSGEPYPPNAFAVTFDDGFENNLSVAAPVLIDLKIPFTIYVTTGFIENNGMSWIDRIEYVVEEAPDQAIFCDWAHASFTLDADTKSRTAFLSAVRAYVKSDPACNPDAFSDDLCRRLGRSAPLSSNDPLDLKMSWDQIRKAGQHDLISIGGHTHTHPILSFLSPEKLAAELDTSLDLLNRKAGVAPKHYSYPEGLEHCFSETVIRELKKRGVQCCPTAIDGLNPAGTDPFHLKRIMAA